MEQVLFYLVVIGISLIGYALMEGVWTVLDEFVLKGISQTGRIRIFFVLTWFFIVANLMKMFIEETFFIALLGGLYGSSISTDVSTELKRLKKKAFSLLS
jgi:hypothetical protein